jgi:LEA14-like dessication related protein
MFPALILLLVAGAMKGAGNNLADKLSYKLVSVQIDKKNSSLKNISLDLVIGVVNPTKTGLTFKSLVVDIFYQDKKLGTLNETKEVSIKPGVQTNMSMTLNLPTASLGIAMAVALFNTIRKHQNPDLLFKGTMKFSAGSLAINTKKTVKVI